MKRLAHTPNRYGTEMRAWKRIEVAEPKIPAEKLSNHGVNANVEVWKNDSNVIRGYLQLL
ncbi:hypothetical protein [Brevibacillus porteri]|uniref:hypothetical protein n=1 Tax=Brevibacillus porteri TaxID=2126350 RepID=UPI003D1F9703